MRHFLIFFTILSSIVYSSAEAARPRSDSPPKFPEIFIDQLIPTQPCIGFQSMLRKKNKILKLSAKEEREYFEKNVIPVVIGPDGKHYMIDHHHFLRAAYEAGRTKVFFQVVHDYNETKPISERSFWSAMKRDKRVYLKNNGNPITVGDLPEKIQDLVDDPYRSLSERVRVEGGYQKSSIPFAEFIWADYFRNLISPWMVSMQFEKAVKMALAYCTSQQTASFPGSILFLNGQCPKFFKKSRAQ